MSELLKAHIKNTESTQKTQRNQTQKNSHNSHPAHLIQRAHAAPHSLSPADVMQLQRTIGNQAVGKLIAEIGRPPSRAKEAVQRQPEEEEEPLQGKLVEAIQREEIPEDEELMQGKFTDECIQCRIPEEEELMQGKGLTLQAKEEVPPNRTGMPDHLKSGLEKLSGIDLSGVRVLYGSSKPAQLNAFAYTQGQEIHVAQGQEKHLPHEGWHAVQQAQGRVKPTMQLKDGVAVNDNEGLEKEADVMGAKAIAYTTQLQAIQRAKRDKSGNFEGLDMATSSLVGVAHEENKSYATVKSQAWMSSQAHSVVYEIKWDAAVVPGGKHLGQVEGQASDWVVDKSKDGVPIGDRKGKNAPYFNNDIDWNHASETGRYFYFDDAIEQRRLRGGSWWFRLKVVDKHNNVLSQSHDVEVNWGE